MDIMKIADKLYKVFVVAGSEPLGTAGIQADMKAIVACGGYAAGAVICIVDEDTTHVKGVHLIPADMIRTNPFFPWRCGGRLHKNRYVVF